MPWGRMDDKFHRNPKVRALRRLKGGRDALGVWVYWWSWCLDDSELSGFVPADELPAQDAKAAKLLVEAGLWDVVAGGYAFHDFSQYNPTSEQVAAKRSADRERVAARRAAEKEASRTNVASDTDATSERVASTRVPSHPIPSQPSMHACVTVGAPEVSREWHAAMQSAGASGLHAAHSWRPDYETVAAACANVDGDALTAVVALCRWFWLAPDGPVKAGRVRMHFATPGHLAKRVSTDLLAAAAWWATQQEAAQ